MLTNKRPEPDYCTEEGAAILAARLEAYWRAQGKDYEFRVESMKYVNRSGSRVFAVRSNMKNVAPK